MTRLLIALIITTFTSHLLLAQDAYKDCTTAEQVLEATNYRYGDIPGTGDKSEQLGYFKNGYEIRETNSVWLSWEIAKAGELYFDIIPLNDEDDIDFVLYKSTNGCDAKEEIRSVISGVNVLTDLPSAPCFGATGLSPASDDLSEGSGCAAGDDNYAKSVQAQQGEVYFLLINNYYDKTGFKLQYHGSAEFTNPENPQTYGKLKLEVLSVYPNPAIDYIQVELPSNDLSSTRMYVTDIGGRIVQQVTEVAATTTLNISDLVAGSYNVVVETGDTREVSRFIKQ